MIGLGEVKTRIKDLRAYVAFQQQCKKAGLLSQLICTHLAFSGPLGTGETTVAKAVRGLLKPIEALEKRHFTEAVPGNLVERFADYTAANTAELGYDRLIRAKL